MSRYPGFVGPAYRSQSELAGADRLMNWFVERMEHEAEGIQAALYPTPGLRAAVTSVETPGRGLFARAGKQWAAQGQTLYELLDAGLGVFTLTNRGTIARDDNPATLATLGISGADQLFITSGTRGDHLDLDTNTFTPGVVSGVTFGGMLNGRFVALDAETSTLKISNNSDGTTWDPTQIAQRSTAADGWISMLVHPPGIWLLGAETGDIWYDTGASPFPLAPIPGVLILQGIKAKFSLKRLRGGPVWLTANEDGDGIVVQAQGYRPARVSNYAVEQAIKTYKATSRIDDAIAWTYQDGGHEFYVLNFPSAGATWVWDPAFGILGWHERGHWNARRSMYEAWGPQYHAMVNGAHVVSDHRTGTIYTMATDYYADTDGDPLRRMRIAPGLQSEHRRMFFDRFALQLEPGITPLITGQGANPQVMMQYSNNGGKTWSGEKFRSAGAIGAYDHLVEWWGCGSAKGLPRLFKTVVTDPTPWRILDAYLDVSVAA